MFYNELALKLFRLIFFAEEKKLIKKMPSIKNYDKNPFADREKKYNLKFSNSEELVHEFIYINK